MALVAAQIESIRRAGLQVSTVQINREESVKYARAVPRVRRRARSVDVVHAHYGYCGWLARAQFRRPVVVSFMGSDLLGIPDRTGNLTAFSRLMVYSHRQLARLVSVVIVKSEQMARVVAPVPAHVIPNGVDLAAFRPIDARAARAELGWSDDRYYVLFPGSPDLPRKNFALAQESVRRSSAHLGCPIELVPLRGLAHHQVALYMAASHALLMTSLLEGSPNAVKEAMACNLPVVSVPVGDVPSLLSGVDNSVVCPRDPQAIAHGLADILTGDGRSNGRDALQRKALDAESVARQIIAIYRDAVRG
jgi:glycosyltransferase involved in cell wall biosynthesis